MKRRLFGVAAALLSVLAGLVPDSVQAALPNLISNPSVETVSATPGVPEGWLKSKWGTNTVTFAYPTNGYTSSRSVKVTVKSYTSGDAKWYFNPVTVSGGTKYVFSDYYKASVPTETVVQSDDGAGNLTYTWLGTNPATTAWVRSAYSFIAPATAQKLTVFHLINKVGWLQTDNFSLSVAETPPPPPVPDNGIPNGSAEVVSELDPDLPQGWQKSNWGTNTPLYEYPSTGHLGNRSLKVTLTSYSSGDAKWVYESVSVTPGGYYRFTDFYQSNVTAFAVAELYHNDGSISYLDLGAISPSTSWKQFITTFQVPTDVSKVVVFQFLNALGWLQTDDYTLDDYTPVPDSGIPNGSLEQAAGDLPLGWRGSTWGTNTPLYEYLTTGHTGTRSVKVTLTSYSSGDAKWVYDPVTVTPGADYRFSTYYQSNVTTRVVAELHHNGGLLTYQGLPAAEPSATWRSYSETFSVPTDVSQVVIFQLIATTGWLLTDDYSLAPYIPVGFSRALLTLTFDDGWEENVTTVLPRLNTYGFKSTQFYATQYIESVNDPSGVLQFWQSGHEIGSHTVTHPDLTTLSDAQLDYELAHSKQYLESIIGVPVTNFATPYGAYDSRVLAKIKEYYASHRSVDVGYNSKDNFNIYNVRVQNILVTTTAADIASWVTKAQHDRTWLVLVYHRVSNNNPGPYDSRLADFDSHLSAIQSSGIPVVPYQQALTEIQSQL